MKSLVLAALVTAWAAVAGAGDSRISERTSVPCFESEARFFELFRDRNAHDRLVESKEAPPWDAEKIMAYFADDKIIYNDINDVYGDRVLLRAVIREGLFDRKGPAYRLFLDMSNVYSTALKHYSQMSYTFIDDGTVKAQMAGWYRVTFRVEGARRVVTRIDDLAEAG